MSSDARPLGVGLIEEPPDHGRLGFHIQLTEEGGGRGGCIRGALGLVGAVVVVSAIPGLQGCDTPQESGRVIDRGGQVLQGAHPEEGAIGRSLGGTGLGVEAPIL